MIVYGADKKIIGTLVPLSALHSNKSPHATFETGELFLDWLARSKQNAWQLLPLSETQLEKLKTTAPQLRPSSAPINTSACVDPSYKL